MLGLVYPLQIDWQTSDSNTKSYYKLNCLYSEY